MNRYIITRDFTRPDGSQGRQCWTGERWSAEIEEVTVYHHYVEAMLGKLWLDRSTRRNPTLRVPGLKVMECDIRQLRPDDFPGR